MRFIHGVVYVALLISLAVVPGFATPPPWTVGTVVDLDLDGPDVETILPRLLIQFPGSPVDCAEDFDEDWCIWLDCHTGSLSTYQCLKAPMFYSCLAFLIDFDVIHKITNIDSDACKGS